MAKFEFDIRGKRAAIIEDDEATHLQLRKALSAGGLRVVAGALNAQDGIDLVMDKRPDIVLIDSHMPGFPDGLDAAETILLRHPACVVLLTSYGNEDYRERAESLQLSGVIVKPVATDMLLSELRKAFGEWRRSFNANNSKQIN